VPDYRTRSPAVARLADRTAWQLAFFLGGGRGVGTPILGQQMSVGGQRLYRWIGRWWISYRLSIVTMSLFALVWLQFATHVLGGGVDQYPCFVGKGRVDNGCIKQALVNVRSLLIVCWYSLAVMRHANFGGWDPYFGKTGVRRGPAMVLLDRALVSSYMLSIVTRPLTEAVWPQFAMQVFGVHQYPRLGGMGNRGVQLIPQVSGRTTLFGSLDIFQ